MQIMEKKNCFCLLFVAILLLKGTCAYATEGALRGKFAISATDTVAFSRGNLQYQPSTSTWRFAENQWDFVGNGELGTVYEDGVKSNNALFYTYTYAYGYKYKGWMDLFGWGTGTKPTTGSTSNSDYNSWNEWGNNAIANGGNKSKLWRTLTKSEWEYVIWERDSAESLFGVGTVNGVNGTILLPDNWIIPEGLTFKAHNNTDSTAAPNKYSADEWMLMEMAGAVFLPITLERNMTPWYTAYCHTVFTEQEGRYWTKSNSYYMVTYHNGNVNRNGQMDNNYVGKAVRLVQNHEGGDLFPVVPNTNSAMFQWKSVPNAETYTLHVFSDSTRTEEAFYITFDRDGKVTGLHFIPHAPSRKSETDSTYTDRLFFYTLKGLQANTDYWYSISGEDANGQTLQTTEGTFKTAAIEAASDRVTVDPAQTSAVFMWPTDSAANTYQIDIYKDGATFCHLTLGPTGTLVGISFAPGKNAPSDTTVPSSLSFNVTGLDAASRYNYVLSTLDANGTPIHVYTGAFATTGYSGDKPVGDGQEVIPTPPVIPANPEASETPTGVEDVQIDRVSSTKVIMNGQLYLMYEGRMYDVRGHEIK